MRIAAPSPAELLQGRSCQRGFTLLEILVVLVIIGIVTSMAVLNIGDRKKEVLQKESQRIVALIKLARDEAILQGREYGLGFWRNHYQFYELDEENSTWSPVQGDRQLRLREIPESLSLTLEMENQEINLAAKPPEKPQIFLLSSGETTAFTLQIEPVEWEDDAVILEYDQLGRLQE